MSKKVTITRKIKLTVNEDNKDLKSTYWDRLREISDNTYRAANDCISFLYMKDQASKFISFSKYKPSEYFKLEKAERSILNKESKEKMDELFNNEIGKSDYRSIAARYPQLPSYIIPSIVRNVKATYKTLWIEIQTGASSLQNFKKGYPSPIITKQMKFNEKYEFNYCGIPLKLFFGKDKSNNKEIVDSCISEEYKLCNSSIQLDGKNLYLLLVVQFDKEEVELDSKISVGVDLGISCAAVVAVNKGLKRLFIPNSIIKPRLRIQAQRRQMYKALKYAKGGRGRQKKLGKYEQIQKSERNTVKTLNHKIALEIVRFAVKNKAATIYIEDLSGISKDDKSSWILRNWSYFELQSFITYKANKYGIEVKKIKPAYTSQVCNKCRCKGERLNQSEFKCHNKDCDIDIINADYNAAKNIANSGLGYTYNEETRSYFAELSMGELCRPKPRVKKSTRQLPTINSEPEVCMT